MAIEKVRAHFAQFGIADRVNVFDNGIMRSKNF